MSGQCTSLPHHTAAAVARDGWGGHDHSHFTGGEAEAERRPLLMSPSRETDDRESVLSGPEASLGRGPRAAAQSPG